MVSRFRGSLGFRAFGVELVGLGSIRRISIQGPKSYALNPKPKPQSLHPLPQTLKPTQKLIQG